MEMQAVTAGRYGGGFVAFGDIQVNASKLLIANATAVAWDGGGIFADKSMQVGLSYQRGERLLCLDIQGFHHTFFVKDVSGPSARFPVVGRITLWQCWFGEAAA